MRRGTPGWPSGPSAHRAAHRLLSRPMSCQHAVLTIYQCRLSAFRLPGGGLTLDEDEAAEASEREARTHFESLPPRVPLPPRLTRVDSPTPGRYKSLLRLVQYGRLTAGAAEGLAPGGRVDDRAWARIRDAVRDLREEIGLSGQAEPDQVNRWAAALDLPDGPGRVEWDPLAHPVGPFPSRAIVCVLDQLGAAGWRTLHVSEDRGIDSSASYSHVACARYTLIRE